MKGKDALVIVDVQNDFCPGGALAVRNGDRVVPVLNRYIDILRSAAADLCYARLAPAKDESFQELWRPMAGALCSGNQRRRVSPRPGAWHSRDLLSKGMAPDEDSYSAFQGIDSVRNPARRLAAPRRRRADSSSVDWPPTIVSNTPFLTV